MPDAQALAEATTALLYLSPYVRHAGLCSDKWVDLSLPAPQGALEKAYKKLPPFVPEPPSAVTTRSFRELVAQRTRPVRYGPHEVRSPSRLPQPLARASLTRPGPRTPFTALRGPADGAAGGWLASRARRGPSRKRQAHRVNFFRIT